MPDLSYEIKLGRLQGKVIAGVDEVGRGPLAGPVFAAAVVIPNQFPPALSLCIRDSKKLSPPVRERLFDSLTGATLYAVAQSTVQEIDDLNILQASLLAMRRALNALPIQLDAALIDGNKVPDCELPCHALVKGDDKSLSIAAASIIAKVVRDRFMKSLALDFPNYGWENNAGYGTSQHMKALQEQGATIWHRCSFAPVRNLKAVRNQ